MSVSSFLLGPVMRYRTILCLAALALAACADAATDAVSVDAGPDAVHDATPSDAAVDLTTAPCEVAPVGSLGRQPGGVSTGHCPGGYQPFTGALYDPVAGCISPVIEVLSCGRCGSGAVGGCMLDQTSGAMYSVPDDGFVGPPGRPFVHCSDVKFLAEESAPGCSP